MSMLIRPATQKDIADLEYLANESGVGMTTLPSEKVYLQEKIDVSERSFARDTRQPGQETYLLLMEDTERQVAVGSCAIIASVGKTKPFYSFRIINLTHTSQELDKYEPVSVLQMADEYRGATEIATLYLTPEYRRNGNGRLLSRCRFLYLAEQPQRFSRLVLAEMRGVQNDQGHSVFWDNLGRHFFNMDFSKADYLSSLGNYQFIADLMPKYPVYIRLLPEEAQEVIGITHQATRPALKLLEREGFRFEGCVDIFDAGPTVHCPLDQIRTVRDSHRSVVSEIIHMEEKGQQLISNTSAHDFRCCRGDIAFDKNRNLVLSSQAGNLLQVRPGDSIRSIEF